MADDGSSKTPLHDKLVAQLPPEVAELLRREIDVLVQERQAAPAADAPSPPSAEDFAAARELLVRMGQAGLAVVQSAGDKLEPQALDLVVAESLRAMRFSAVLMGHAHVQTCSLEVEKAAKRVQGAADEVEDAAGELREALKRSQAAAT